MSEAPRLLSVGEAAERLSLSTRQVRALAGAGKLAASKRPDRRVKCGYVYEFSPEAIASEQAVRAADGRRRGRPKRLDS